MSVRSTVPLIGHNGTKFSVATGSICVDLVLTGGLGFRAQWETLHTPADVARWAAVAGLVEGVDVAVSDDEFALTYDLREALYESIDRMADGLAPTRAAVESINTIAAEPDLVPQLVGPELVVLAPVRGSQVLSSVAREFVSLASGPYSGRVRRCAGSNCAIPFVDTSRPGARRWCAMSRCGNRDKARTRRRSGKVV